MERDRFAKIANSDVGGSLCVERQRRIKEAINFLVKEFNIEFGDFKIHVHQGKASERIEINKSLQVRLTTH